MTIVMRGYGISLPRFNQFLKFMSNYERIQQQLQFEANMGPFYEVVTDTETKLVTVDTLTPLAPASVIVQEESASFSRPLKHRRTDRLERISWRWSVVCTFNVDVIAEAIEKRLIENPIILDADPVNDLQQVTIKLLDSNVSHPPQQNPSYPTRVNFTFEAESSPV